MPKFDLKIFRTGLTPAFLAAMAVVYGVAVYLSPYRPGKQPYPLGWYGWVDQGAYIKSVRGF